MTKTLDKFINEQMDIVNGSILTQSISLHHQKA